jgi:hypothetical protein
MHQHRHQDFGNTRLVTSAERGSAKRLAFDLSLSPPEGSPTDVHPESPGEGPPPEDPPTSPACSIGRAYMSGLLPMLLSTRALDNLVQALGINRISKDQVDRICMSSRHRSTTSGGRGSIATIPTSSETPPSRRSERTVG